VPIRNRERSKSFDSNLCAVLLQVNAHVRDKIRQQLQVLRDMGLLEFIGGGLSRAQPRGSYRLT